jgi:hypothetical protein
MPFLALGAQEMSIIVKAQFFWQFFWHCSKGIDLSFQSLAAVILRASLMPDACENQSRPKNFTVASVREWTCSFS